MNHNALREDYYKYAAWIKASGIHSQELYKAEADFWLSKFDAYLSGVKDKIEKMKTVKNHRYDGNDIKTAEDFYGISADNWTEIIRLENGIDMGLGKVLALLSKEDTNV